MRGIVAGLASPHPLGGLMPAVFQEDAFTMRWTGALDEVLAPVPVSLDSIEAYVDPLLAPEDFVAWLACWCGIALDENWPLPRRRAVVAAAAELYRARGTVAGLRRHVELVTGGRVEVADSGGVTWSADPGGAPGPATGAPGSAAVAAAVGAAVAALPGVTVRVLLADPAQVNVRALDALIGAIKPAHVIHKLEVAGS
jgi:phage tail-like protein